MKALAIVLAALDFAPLFFQAVGLLLLARLSGRVEPRCRVMAFSGFLLALVGGAARVTANLVLAFSGLDVPLLAAVFAVFAGPGLALVAGSARAARAAIAGAPLRRDPWLVPVVSSWVYLIAAFVLQARTGSPVLAERALVALGWAAWALRSDALRFAGTFHEQSSTWRTAGATGPEAVERILRVSLKILQQLWLAHWGLGATIWVLLGAALAVALRGRAPSRAVAAWGLVTLAGLGTVLALFAVLPFTVDVVAGVQPFRSREFLLCWDNFARVGLGRMVVHLLPAGAFFVLAVVEDSASPSS